MHVICVLMPSKVFMCGSPFIQGLSMICICIIMNQQDHNIATQLQENFFFFSKYKSLT